MKTVVLAVFLCAMVMNDASAQRTRIGLKGGLNSSTLSDFSNTESRQAFHAGGFARFGWPGRAALQLDILYSRQGVRLEDNTRLNFDYASFPLVSKLYVTPLLNLQAGAQVALALSTKSVTDGVTSDINLFVEDFDFAWVLGLGADFRSGFTLEGRYNLGVSNTNKGQFPGVRPRNRTIQLSLGYAFSNKSAR